MNVKLSVYSHRVLGKSGFMVSKEGGILDIKISSTTSANIKEDALTRLADGLVHCRPHVNHSDILYIEVQNQHLCSWLTGRVEYKGYSEKLDKVFEVLETLDCRYKFVFVKDPEMKGLIKKEVSLPKGESLIKDSLGSSLADTMKDFE